MTDSDEPRRLFRPADLPGKISAIDGIDFSADLTADPLGGDWIRLGVRSLPGRDIAARHTRECFLIALDQIAATFAALDYIGEALDGLGQPVSWITTAPSGGTAYGYNPAHNFELRHSGIFVESLVAIRYGTVGAETFLINPDLWLELGLEETSSGSGSWWDRARGIEVLRRRHLADAFLEAVEIRRDALLRYLRDRQRALVIGEFRAARRDRPSADDLAAFDTQDIVLERDAPFRAKAIVRSNGPGAGITRETRQSLYRWLHLWIALLPPALNTTRPFDEQPAFDVYAFTLPTRDGEAAPARYRGAAGSPEKPYSGVLTDHMTPVYFRQAVLEKYQGSATYVVSDDGGVQCDHFWSTGPSTRLLANEFVAIPIGDFGIHVPFDDWPHWKQHAVAPPGRETLDVAYGEPAIVDLVNDLFEKFKDLNQAFYVACFNHGVDGTLLWDGSLDTPAGRNLKRYYRDDAHDDVFLERATFAATLLDELRAKPLKAFLRSFDTTLHLDFETGDPLRSFRLLQRAALAVQISVSMHPQRETISRLVRAAEGYGEPGLDPNLLRDLEQINADVRSRLAPLALLTEVRNKAGVAHKPASSQTLGEIVGRLGLPKRGWKRREYISFLQTIGAGVATASALLGGRE